MYSEVNDNYIIKRMSCENANSLNQILFSMIMRINVRKLILIRILNNGRWHNHKEHFVVQSLSCLWLFNPMDCSTPGFPDQTWSTGGENGTPLQYSCHKNPMSSIQRMHQLFNPLVVGKSHSPDVLSLLTLNLSQDIC